MGLKMKKLSYENISMGAQVPINICQECNSNKKQKVNVLTEQNYKFFYFSFIKNPLDLNCVIKKISYIKE